MSSLSLFYYAVLYIRSHVINFLKINVLKKQNGTFRGLSLMCNEATTRRQTGQRFSWKQSDESKVLRMEKKKKKTNGKSWATVLFLHCDEYERRNVWCWGKKKGRRRASHTKQMKVSECIIQEAGQGMFENIFKRMAGSLPASVCVLNIGTASSVWRNWYWLNNLSRLRLKPLSSKTARFSVKEFYKLLSSLVWRSSVSGGGGVFVLVRRRAKGVWWRHLVTYWPWRRPTVSTQLADRANL